MAKYNIGSASGLMDKHVGIDLETKLVRIRAALANRAPVLDASFPSITLMFSVSDGAARAIVVQGSGVSVDAAWEVATTALRKVMTRKKLAGRFLRLDWIEKVETLTWELLRKRLLAVKRNYCRRGIALDADFQHLFLEQELNAGAMLYGGNQINHCVVNEKNFLIAAQQKYGSATKCDFSDNKEVYLVDTEGLFCAEDGEIYELYGTGRNAGRRKVETLDVGTLRNVIADASDFLSNQVGADGRFIYGYHPCFDREIPAYNALRHASTTYSMLEAWEQTRRPALLAAIDRALEYLCRELIHMVGEDLAFVVDTGNEIKLGANATAVLALAKYSALLDTDRYASLMEKLAQGILHMQDDSGSFTHVLTWPSLAVKQRFRIVYYEGEAAFALMRLYSLTKDERWIEAVEKAFVHFIEKDYWKHHDHWLSYCTNELTLYRPEERYFRFGIRNFESHLDFVFQRITTFPTLLELMMAGRKMLDRLKGMPLGADLLAGVDEKKFNEALHFRAGYLLNGHFWPELAMFFRNPMRILGSFFIRHHAFRVRIDDVEHYLSGLIAYRSYELQQQNTDTKMAAEDVQKLGHNDYEVKKPSIRRPPIGMLRSEAAPGTRTLATAYVAESLGINLVFFNAKDVDIKDQTINARIFKSGRWQRSLVGYPYVIDNDEASRRYHEVWDSLNAQSIMTTPMLGGKVVSLGKLRSAGIYTKLLIPDAVITDVRGVLDFSEEHLNIIIKPVQGSQGKAVYFITRQAETFSVLLGNDQVYLSENEFIQLIETKFLGGKFIIQKYVPSITEKGLPYDIRLHTQRGEGGEWKTTKIYARIGQGQTITSNLSSGGSIADAQSFLRSQFGVRSQKLWNDLLNIAANFPAELQKLYDSPIDAIGIDLGLDKAGRPWLFEINSYPGSKYFEFQEANIRVPYLMFLAGRHLIPEQGNGSKRPSLEEFAYAATAGQNDALDKRQTVRALSIDDAGFIKDSVAFLRLNGNLGASVKSILRHREKIIAVVGEVEVCPVPNLPYIKVKCTRDALKTVAAARRERFEGDIVTVIGSVGKTSATHLLAHALRRVGKSAHVNSTGNIPNYIAAGLAVMPTNVDYALFEVAGATSPNKEPIGLTSTRLLCPSICLLTNIVPAHMDKMGTMENAAVCKGAAFGGVKPLGAIVVNRDIPHFDSVVNQVPSSVRILTFGKHEAADIRLLKAEGSFSFSITILGRNSLLSLQSNHEGFVMNALGVIGVLCAAGIDPEAAVTAVANRQPMEGRGAVIELPWQGGSIRVIDDAYNANPGSMHAAFKHLSHQPGRRVAVIGEMAELGLEAINYHTALSASDSIRDIDRFYVMGDLYTNFWENIPEAKKGYYAASLNDLKQKLFVEIMDGDAILFKGSNSTLIHELIKDLKKFV